MNMMARKNGEPAALRLVGFALSLALVAPACGDDDDKTTDGKQSSLCDVRTLEADLDATPFMGPGVDPATGELTMEAGSSFVVSSTYGVPERGADGVPTQRYLEIFSAIQEQLGVQPGLVALKLASSESCGSGRTLAIWKSEDEMYDFVTSDAHLAAMKEANELLKPGFGVTHWSATSAEQTSWQEAVKQLSAVY
jgi:hypothetical protein